ncbi:MAG TPA: alanine--tRNA ligase, partial [Armatimonadota bacterium]|nr:alanine--tRNA ligase [Armatimonadota bacterium]
MTGNEIRAAFLRFFAERGHTVLPSSSLVPEDPTTLFTTAGMQQFVPWFRREVEPPYGSVATVQKCARTDDLDNVGHTARHHTFFEMLGNFSFGDYFKRETLRWGWEFSTLPQSEGGLGLDPERVWVTYYKPKPGEPYREDLEAKQLWLEIGVPDARIIPLSKKENWWGPVGDSGPCGPCSEMHYDRGEHLACGPDCTSPACGCDRWVEFWNHVFQQFNYQGGAYRPLPAPGIDTGAGLERIASLVQDVPTNFATDLLSPLIIETMTLAKLEKTDAAGTVALRVIADHLRCAAFMIADGVLPSNSKRGYVARRIIRRAFRFGRALGLHAPFLWQLVPTLDGVMGGHYHELRDNARFIADTLRAEEERFADTLERGEELLAALIGQAKAAGATALNGADVFTLYDTYGFPRELTAETALEAGLAIDEAGFTAAMDAARARARAGGKFGYEAAAMLGAEVPATAFTGYVTTETEATLLHFAANADRTYATVVLDT